MKISQKLLLTLCCGLLSFFLLYQPMYPVYASSASDSANIIQQKIEELKAEIASKAAQIKQEITKRLQNKVLVGTVLSKDDKQLTVLNPQSEEKKVLINDYTVVDKKLAVKSYIIALGEIDDKDNLVAKKIIVSQKPDDNKIISWGELQSTEKSVLKLKQKDNSETSFKLLPNTNISSKQGDLKISDLQNGLILVTVAVKKEDATPSARFIYVITKKVKRPEATSSSSKKP